MRSNVSAAVAVALMSLASKPSAPEISAYASTLLPLVTVASAASHGSFCENGTFCTVIRFGETYEGNDPSGVPVGCGMKSAVGPLNGT